VLDAAADDASALVRETAVWARARLRDGMDTGGGGRMLTIERVICLKAVPMFAEVSDEILADVAELLGEVDYAKGQVVFEKGAEGDSLYVVISGRVRVYDGARTIVELGPKEIFGELALLDPEPRLAFRRRRRGHEAVPAGPRIVRGADGGQHRSGARRPARVVRTPSGPRRVCGGPRRAGQGRTLRIKPPARSPYNQEVR
jgi:hypothetical protein